MPVAWILNYQHDFEVVSTLPLPGATRAHCMHQKVACPYPRLHLPVIGAAVSSFGPGGTNQTIFSHAGTSANFDRCRSIWPSTSTCNVQKDLYRRQEATSGNRDMYQEVDLIDIALGSARKQCDDAKERANRLSVTVDRLRDALSRFMSKVR